MDSFGRKVLVTGANGYIGRFVVKYLLNIGIKVIASDFCFDDVDERAEKLDTLIFSGDKDIYQKLGKPDVLIHLAWRNGFVHNADNHMSDLSSHFTFISDMMKGGLKNLSVMGTMHEIGFYEGIVDENTPTNPISLYGIAKNALRQAVINIAATEGVNMKWLRAFYITGDDLRNNSIFAKIIKSAEEGQKTFPFTSGKNLYDFITVDELARQIALSSIQTEVTGVINCCTGKPMSLAERVESFIKEKNLDIRLEYGAFLDRPYDSKGIWGDNTRINQILNNAKL